MVGKSELKEELTKKEKVISKHTPGRRKEHRSHPREIRRRGRRSEAPDGPQEAWMQKSYVKVAGSNEKDYQRGQQPW